MTLSSLEGYFWITALLKDGRKGKTRYLEKKDGRSGPVDHPHCRLTILIPKSLERGGFGGRFGSVTQTIPFSHLQALVMRASANLDGKGLHKFTQDYGQAHGRTTASQFKSSQQQMNPQPEPMAR